MIDLAALGALRAVGTSGSVTAAAEALGYTPSAVSQQIKRLERQAGVPLLERVGRGVMLTGNGRHLAEQGARLLGDLEELQSGLHRQANTVAGHVRLVAFATAVRGLIAPALPPVLRAHPGLRVTVTEREPWDAISQVATGLADLGVAHNWGDIPLPVPDHLARTILVCDLADVIVRRGHPLAGYPVVTPADLAGEDWIATPEASICRQWLYRMFDGTGRLPAIAHVAMEFDSQLALVRAGLGIALIPRLGRAPLGGDLVAVPVADPVPSREIIALHRASMTDSPAIEALLAALGRRAADADLTRARLLAAASRRRAARAPGADGLLCGAAVRRGLGCLAMQRQFRQVDVFTEQALLGNPVAVVHGADDLTDEQMRRFARWTNLSETTFLVAPSDGRADYRVRIFTPKEELPFAGHPTLGSAHAWLEAGGQPASHGEIIQECGVGLVPVRQSPDGRLAFQAPPLIRSGPVDEPLLEEIAASLGIGRQDIVDAQWADNGPGWVAVELATADAVLALVPSPSSHDIGVVGRYPPGSPEAFEVRAFTPLINGTGEDPVTGSLNASLAMWLLSSGKATAPYTASQGTVLGRRGRVHVSTDADGSIWVGGSTRTLISGSLHL